MPTVAALYHFARLPDAPARQGPLLALCRAQGLCGTLLLAPEGINVFVCGLEEPARAFAAHLRALEGLSGLSFKESWSDRQSFNRLLVKLKREIITFRQPAYRPASGRAATVDARSLARWLDAGHDDGDARSVGRHHRRAQGEHAVRVTRLKRALRRAGRRRRRCLRARGSRCGRECRREERTGEHDGEREGARGRRGAAGWAGRAHPEN